MKVPVLIPLLAGVMCPFGLPAFAGQQPSERPAAKSPLVTTHMQAASLQAALKELSRSTGVQMTAAPEIAELKVTVLVKDLPLDTVQARLAEALHLTWKHAEASKDQKDSSEAYLLYRSAHDIEEEQNLRARGETAFRKCIDDGIGAFALSPEDRDKLSAKNSRLAPLLKPDSSALAILTLFARLTPQQRAHILDGEKLEFSAEKPPSELVPYIKPIIDAMRKEDKNPSTAYVYDQGGRRFSFERNGEGAGSHLNFTFTANDARGWASFGHGMFSIASGDVYPELYTADHKGADYADADAPHDVPMTLQAESLEALLAKIADTMHINIIGESYFEGVRTHGNPEPVYDHQIPAGLCSGRAAMDTIMPRDIWWKRGSVYLFQRPLWWKDRRIDVSNPTQLHLMEILAHPTLSLGDGAEICKSLNPEQFQWLYPRYIRNYIHLQPMQDVLRFYGHLPPALREQLFQESGMELSGLEEAEQKRLTRWITERSNAAMENVQNTPGSVRIMALCPSHDRQFGAVTFRAFFQPKDGAAIVLREQEVLVTDPTEHIITSEDPHP